MKNFLTVLGWVGSKENKLWSPCIFSLDPPKSSQNGENTEGRKLSYLIDKSAHVQFLLFFFLPEGCHFFFWVVGVIVVLFCFFFFFCLTRHDFFF